MEIHLPFGLRNNKIVHISEIGSEERGLKCNCVCPSCGVSLQARIGEIRRRHFSHNSENCQGASESSLHRFAKDILESSNRIFLPDYYYDNDVLISGRFFEYRLVELEKRIGNVIVDALLSDGENRLIVEIVVTHDVDEHKYSKLEKLGDSVLRINLYNLYNKGMLSINSDEITKLIIDNSIYKTWIFNKKANSKIIKLKKEKELAEWKLQEAKEKIRLKKAEEIELLVNEFIRIFGDNKKLVHDENCKVHENKISMNSATYKWFNNMHLDYLNYEIDGELIIDCNRTIWQIELFERFVRKNMFHSFRIKHIVNWIENMSALPINRTLHQTTLDMQRILNNNGYRVASLEDLVFLFLSNIEKNRSETIKYFNVAIDIIDHSFKGTGTGYKQYEFKIRNSAYYRQLQKQKEHINRDTNIEYVVIDNANLEHLNVLKKETEAKTDDMLYQEAREAQINKPEGPWYDTENNRYGVCEKCLVLTRNWISFKDNCCKCKDCYN